MDRLKCWVLVLLAACCSTSPAQEAVYTIAGDVAKPETYSGFQTPNVTLADLLLRGQPHTGTGRAVILRGRPPVHAGTTFVQPGSDLTQIRLADGDIIFFHADTPGPFGYPGGTASAPQGTPNCVVFADAVPRIVELSSAGTSISALTNAIRPGSLPTRPVPCFRTTSGQLRTIQLDATQLIAHGDLLLLSEGMSVSGARISELFVPRQNDGLRSPFSGTPLFPDTRESDERTLRLPGSPQPNTVADETAQGGIPVRGVSQPQLLIPDSLTDRRSTTSAGESNSVDTAGFSVTNNSDSAGTANTSSQPATRAVSLLVMPAAADSQLTDQRPFDPNAATPDEGAVQSPEPGGLGTAELAAGGIAGFCLLAAGVTLIFMRNQAESDTIRNRDVRGQRDPETTSQKTVTTSELRDRLSVLAQQSASSLPSGDESEPAATAEMEAAETQSGPISISRQADESDHPPVATASEPERPGLPHPEPLVSDHEWYSDLPQNSSEPIASDVAIRQPESADSDNSDEITPTAGSSAAFSDGSASVSDFGSAAPITEQSDLSESAVKSPSPAESDSGSFESLSTDEDSKPAAPHLDALLSNRLPVHREATDLPRTLSLYGRATTPLHLRVDPEHREVAAPHFMSLLKRKQRSTDTASRGNSTDQNTQR